MAYTPFNCDFKSYIYIITNLINNKIYIGQSINPSARFYQHIHDSKSNSLVYRAIQKYGVENFSFEIIVCGFDIQIVDQLEKYYISLYKSTDRQFGYNIENGGSLTKSKSLETRKKISEAKKGVKLPPQHGIKISKALKGKPKSKEHVEKVRQANIGKKRSEEYCKKHKEINQKTRGQKIKATNLETNEIFFFPAIREAARQLNYSYKRVRSALVDCHIMDKKWRIDYGI